MDVWSNYDEAEERAETINRIVENTGVIPEALKKATLEQLSHASPTLVGRFYDKLTADAMRQLK